MFSKFTSSSLFPSYSIDPSPSGVAGPWKIYQAKRKNGSAASVFVFDKKSLDQPLQKTSSSLKQVHQQVYARLKQEAQFVAKFRHPSILELVEAAEESRTQIAFITEPIITSLRDCVRADGFWNNNLDEIEVQKGLLSVTRGLEFLSDVAGVVVCNLTLDGIVINNKGDWKIFGLGFATYFKDGEKGEYLGYDPRLPRGVQQNIDYMAPELVLESRMSAQNDMFSLGCVIAAVYSGSSPIKSNQNPSTYRQELESLNISRLRKLPPYLKGVLPALLAKRPPRPTAAAFVESKYFDNILLNTIRFLDDFPSKSSDKKSSFMKGLPKVLPQFPESVLQRKILPGLLDQSKDVELLPLILPNVFYIGRTLSTLGFSNHLLDPVKHFFTEKSSPGATAVCLENMPLLIEKTSSKQFKDDCIPLLFTALEMSTVLQDRALQLVPAILKVLDLPTVKLDVLPRIAAVFTNTTSLLIKCSSLRAFIPLVEVLDKYTLTDKLIPLMSNIRTKEPEVTVATFDVYARVIPKLEPSVLATSVLPQLWALSLSPMLRLEQFRQFQNVIKRAEEKIVTEHEKRLRETEPVSPRRNRNEEIDFEKLVVAQHNAPNAPSKFGKSATRSPDDDWDAWATSITPDLPDNPTPPPRFIATKEQVGAPTLPGGNQKPYPNTSGRTKISAIDNNRPSQQPIWPVVSTPMLSTVPSNKIARSDEQNKLGVNNELDKYASLL